MEYMTLFNTISLIHQASSIKHQASSIKHHISLHLNKIPSISLLHLFFLIISKYCQIIISDYYKFFLKEFSMLKNKKINKILSLIGLFVLTSLFSISCSSKQNPTENNSTIFKPSDLVGTWNCTDEGLTSDSFTISSDGKISLTAGGQSLPVALTIQNWEADKNKEVSSYSVKLDLSGTSASQYGTVTFNFKSTSECELTASGMPGGVQHFKK